MTNPTERPSSRQFATALLIGASSTKLLSSDAPPTLRLLFGCAVTTASILSIQPRAEGLRAMTSLGLACASSKELPSETPLPLRSVFISITALSLFQLLSPQRRSIQTDTNPPSSNQRREPVGAYNYRPHPTRAPSSVYQQGAPPTAAGREPVGQRSVPTNTTPAPCDRTTTIVLPPSNQTREPVGPGSTQRNRNNPLYPPNMPIVEDHSNQRSDSYRPYDNRPQPRTSPSSVYRYGAPPSAAGREPVGPGSTQPNRKPPLYPPNMPIVSPPANQTREPVGRGQSD